MKEDMTVQKEKQVGILQFQSQTEVFNQRQIRNNNYSNDTAVERLIMIQEPSGKSNHLIALENPNFHICWLPCHQEITTGKVFLAANIYSVELLVMIKRLV
ncbi:unnamed protein product [Cuscuta europaea]|uniref:Receptor L-domain domain-containing protein n=1 Tax=Cuscuta europaea TaxID=41803 RepID=A0A9P1E330_CUSEU|nr:unnamed protein product [Cuscuta europaea]